LERKIERLGKKKMRIQETQSYLEKVKPLIKENGNWNDKEAVKDFESKLKDAAFNTGIDFRNAQEKRRKLPVMETLEKLDDELNLRVKSFQRYRK
jgi:hypothetical protein